MAVNGTYNVSAETPIGKKSGTIVISGATDGGEGSCDAQVKIDGIGVKLEGAQYKGDKVKVKGEFSMLIAKAPFELKLTVKGDEISGRAESGDYGIDVAGKRA